MKPVFLLSTLFVVVLAAGCDLPLTPRYSVEVRTDRDSYRAGDSVVVTIANRSSHTVWWSLCNSVIEKKFAVEDWRSAEGWHCPGIPIPSKPISPNDRDVFRWRAREQAGTYRFHFWIGRDKGYQSQLPAGDRLSNEFTVSI
ncbi:MAG: hypothetical protein ACRDGA_07195 [Bacteroidota bacterium]